MRPSDPCATLPSTVIAEICRVLGLSKFDPGDNFFAIGGDSMSAIDLVDALSHRGISIEVADIFEYQTVESLISYIEHRTSQVT